MFGINTSANEQTEVGMLDISHFLYLPAHFVVQFYVFFTNEFYHDILAVPTAWLFQNLMGTKNKTNAKLEIKKYLFGKIEMEAFSFKNMINIRRSFQTLSSVKKWHSLKSLLCYSIQEWNSAGKFDARIWMI